jgi:hypothetical protein
MIIEDMRGVINELECILDYLEEAVTYGEDLK